jgi:conjugative relaxase-like TrwC/TraI family protein
MLIVLSAGPAVVPYFLDGRHPGRWTDGAASLFGLAGAVDGTELRRLLEGRDPHDGRYLPAVRPHRRRGGWDLVFGAPKSVSLLSTADGPGARTAHAAAVAAVLGHIESRLAAGSATRIPCEGLVGACFEHTTNAAGEPHLHTHVLVANLSRAAGEWRPVRSGDWFVGRSALAALYQMHLRHSLAATLGPGGWRLRPDGMADLADVPREVVRATSTQAQSVAAAGRYAARRTAVPADWRARLSAAGLAPPRFPTAAGAGGAAPDDLADPSVRRAVEVRLSARRSDFRMEDVITALCASCPAGAPVGEAVRWAEEFCAASPPVPSPTAGRRWATASALRNDSELLAELGGGPGGATPAPTRPADAVAAVCRATRVAFVGAPPGRCDLLAQAELLHRCRTEWDREGRRVAVDTPDGRSALRWALLSGLPAHRRGEQVDVLVVDQADRRPTAELAALARDRSRLVVFVEGGTLPRLSNPASHGLMAAADRWGRVTSPPFQPWEAAVAGDTGTAPGRRAAARVLDEYLRSPAGTLLVGLGPEEVGALNQAIVGPGRDPSGPGRFAPGDPVIVLRGGSSLPAYGRLGVVRGAPGRRGSPELCVEWEDGSRTATADRRVMGRIGLAHAVTPWLADHTDRPLMVLGPADVLGRGRPRVVPVPGLDRAGEPGGWPPPPPRRYRDRDGPGLGL